MIKFSVTKDKKPFTDYIWDETHRIFSSSEDNLYIDFRNREGITIRSHGKGCIIKAGWLCNIHAASHSVIETSRDCVVYGEDFCNVKCGDRCSVTLNNNSNITVGSQSIVNAGTESNIVTRHDCRVSAYYGNLKVGPESVCKLHGPGSTIKSGTGCVFHIPKRDDRPTTFDCASKCFVYISGSADAIKIPKGSISI